MPSALLLTPFAAEPAGHGGNRRAYQLAVDLRGVVGSDRVVVVQVATAGDPGAGARGPWRGVRRVAGRVAWKIALSAENPASLVARNTFYSRCFSDGARRREVARLAATMPRPVVAVVEHAALLDLLVGALPPGGATVACPANLESLDVGALPGATRRHGWATGIDLANEVRSLARADARLCISRVETALLNGVGVPARHYPYLPVGEIRDGLETVRRARASSLGREVVFVALGSAVHRSTGEAMEWLLDGLAASGLPAGWRVVAGGTGTERFAERSSGGPIDVRGWLADAERDALLARCTAVLAPQRTGFGALTRLPELACAGVPVLVSQHALAALDPPPGAVAVEDGVGAWLDAMRNAAARGPYLVGEEEYAAWARRQEPALARVVAALIERRAGTGDGVPQAR